MAFFGEHGFTLDQLGNVFRLQNGIHNGIMFLGIGGPVYGYPVLLGVGFKFQQIIVQVRQHVVLDLGCRFAQGFPFGYIFGGYIPFLADPPKGPIVPVNALLVFDKLFRQRGMIWAFDAVIDDAAAAATFSRRFFSAALEQELLLRPIGRTVYLMPPYILDDAEIDTLAARTQAVFEQVIGG